MDNKLFPDYFSRMEWGNFFKLGKKVYYYRVQIKFEFCHLLVGTVVPQRGGVSFNVPFYIIRCPIFHTFSSFKLYMFLFIFQREVNLQGSVLIDWLVGLKRKQKIVSGKGKGKKKQKAEDQSSLCGVCKRNCDIDCVCCDLCDTWYHFVCVRMTADEKDLEDDWFCLSCKNWFSRITVYMCMCTSGKKNICVFTVN